MDDASSNFDQTLNNRSVHFNASDGATLDIGDGADSEREEGKSDSEEERKQLYGNDASNQLSYTKMIRVINEKHPRKKVFDEETQKEELRQRGVCKTKTGCHDCCSRDRRSSELA